MFAKRLFQKVTNLSPSSSSQNAKLGSVAQEDLDPRISLHYGIPSTASVLAFDPIQRLMAIGTLDGRIKVIGGDNIEELLISPKKLPYKSLEFLHNKGFLVSISNENDIQVWDLEHRCIACSLQWESNITAFSVIHASYFMYVGDEWGLLSVLKYNAEERKLLQLPYHIPAHFLAETAGVSLTNHESIIGLLPQPCASESRVLIAYEKGLIILWDISEARVVLIRGNKDLQLRDGMIVGLPKGLSKEVPDDTAGQEQEDKEISSLCWASSDGSILAVGYVDGDIMLWNMSCPSSSKGQQSGISSTNVVKLQLSSGERRLPVIVLHWSACSGSGNESGGQLFIYGGDEIGSEEVLTVLSLEWSSGMERLQCVNRTDLTLNGSFSDLILVPNSGAVNNPSNTMFVLTNPGQLHVYDESMLSALSSQEEKQLSFPAIQFPLLVPTVDPYMTVTKLSLVPMGGNSSKTLLEMATVMNLGATPTLTGGSKWPLTGGISSHLTSQENNGVERLYMAGYQDGSVRIWDATVTEFSLIFVLEGKEENIKVPGASASVSALDFCPLTLSLAIGSECGLIRVYKLSGSSGETELHFVNGTKQVNRIHQGKGLQCTAVFSVLNSPIQTLQYTNSGAKLAVGFGCGRVGVFDMTSLSVSFLTESVSTSSNPVISLAEKEFPDIYNIINSSKHQESVDLKDPVDALLYITRDSNLVIVNSMTGNMICSRRLCQRETAAIAMYIIESSISVCETSIEKFPEQQSQNSPTQIESIQANDLSGDAPQELTTSSETTISVDSSLDSLLLLCSEEALRVFSLKSLLKEDYNAISKVSLAKPCCWTTTFIKDDEKACGIALLYQNGVIEIRSLPDLEVITESSLMSILRWSFKANMDKTICSSDNGHISLVNGCEMAFISLLARENHFRVPESLSSLHDKVLAASTDAAINYSANVKKKQGTSPGIIGGIVKGIKGDNQKSVTDPSENLPNFNFIHDLEIIFSKAPFPDPSEALKEALELNIDDLEIDEPVHITPTASHQGKKDKKDKATDREKLFQGATADATPRVRTAEEIRAKYRKAGDASAVASQARDKLLERQEKLEKLSRNTEELQNGAEDFASMAKELAKSMEARKWWKF